MHCVRGLGGHAALAEDDVVVVVGVVSIEPCRGTSATPCNKHVVVHLARRAAKPGVVLVCTVSTGRASLLPARSYFRRRPQDQQTRLHSCCRWASLLPARSCFRRWPHPQDWQTRLCSCCPPHSRQARSRWPPLGTAGGVLGGVCGAPPQRTFHGASAIATRKRARPPPLQSPAPRRWQ